MILNSKYNKNIIMPGVILYENALNILDEDVDTLMKVYENSFYVEEKYGEKIKNIIWHIYKTLNKEDEILYLQKTILKFLAEYVDNFKEAIHVIQWQERITIDIDYPGNPEYIFNPNSSFLNNKKINNIPFSRQLAVEVCFDDFFDGGENSWTYFPEINFKQNKGDILIYPANYLFSRKFSSIISGRRIILTTFFNGGKDFLAEEEEINESQNNLLFSYLR